MVRFEALCHCNIQNPMFVQQPIQIMQCKDLIPWRCEVDSKRFIDRILRDELDEIRMRPFLFEQAYYKKDPPNWYEKKVVMRPMPLSMVWLGESYNFPIEESIILSM